MLYLVLEEHFHLILCDETTCGHLNHYHSSRMHQKTCKVFFLQVVRLFTYKTLTCKCEWLPYNTLHLVSTLVHGKVVGLVACEFREHSVAGLVHPPLEIADLDVHGCMMEVAGPEISSRAPFLFLEFNPWGCCSEHFFGLQLQCGFDGLLGRFRNR